MNGFASGFDDEYDEVFMTSLIGDIRWLVFLEILMMMMMMILIILVVNHRIHDEIIIEIIFIFLKLKSIEFDLQLGLRQIQVQEIKIN